MSKSINQLAIVTGASGEVGRAFVRGFHSYPVDTIALSRSRVEHTGKVQAVHGVDLMNVNATKKAVSEALSTRNEVDRLFLVHPIGKFLYEPTEPTRIDQEIFDSNVATFINVAQSIIDTVSEGISIVLVMLGSITDKFDIPMWRSYSHANNVLRDKIREWIKERISTAGISLDLGTVNVGSERNLRPHADTTYWLSVDEVVRHTLESIINSQNGTFTRVELSKIAPGFDPYNYYRDLAEITKMWNIGMNGSSCNGGIPRDILERGVKIRKTIQVEGFR